MPRGKRVLSLNIKSVPTGLAIGHLVDVLTRLEPPKTVVEHICVLGINGSTISLVVDKSETDTLLATQEKPQPLHLRFAPRRIWDEAAD